MLARCCYPDQEVMDNVKACVEQVRLKQSESVTSQLREVQKLLGAWKQRKQQRLDQHKALKVGLVAEAGAVQGSRHVQPGFGKEQLDSSLTADACNHRMQHCKGCRRGYTVSGDNWGSLALLTDPSQT